MPYSSFSSRCIGTHGATKMTAIAGVLYARNASCHLCNE